MSSKRCPILTLGVLLMDLLYSRDDYASLAFPCIEDGKEALVYCLLLRILSAT